MAKLTGRRKTRTVYIGKVPIGSEHPLSIQSMCNTKTADVQTTLAQLSSLDLAGAQIGRLAVVNMEDADALSAIIEKSPLPLVADIHFDYRLALAAVKAGIAALRINPGNIGEVEKVRAVAQAAKAAGIPIRIGVNSGSVRQDQWQQFSSRSEAMVQLALRDAEVLENAGFGDIKISLKSSDIPEMIDAYRQIGAQCDYPLHVGATEAGTFFRGSIKNALGIGTLLAEGIGDTIRVSLTEEPVREVEVAKEILIMLGLKKSGWQFISCPTCGRTQVDLITLAKKVEEALALYEPPRPLSVAVMGCVVNGPGEAAHADLGVACGPNGGVIFIKGEKVGFYPEDQLLPCLLQEAQKLINETD